MCTHWPSNTHALAFQLLDFHTLHKLAMFKSRAEFNLDDLQLPLNLVPDTGTSICIHHLEKHLASYNSILLQFTLPANSCKQLISVTCDLQNDLQIPAGSLKLQ